MIESITRTPVQEEPPSPRWSSTTKMVVMLTLVALLAFAFVKFQYLVGPMIFVFVLAYLFHPLAILITKKVRVPWRATVTVLYLVVLLVFIGLLTWGGISLIDQVQSLISFLQRTITGLPAFFESLSTTPLLIGPIEIDLTHVELANFSQQILGVVEPVLTRLGGFVGTLASSTAAVIGWIFFCLIVSYFVLVETGGVRERILDFHIPGYQADLERIGTDLGRIWNAYLRGQTVVLLITFLVYSIMLGTLGVKFFVGLALLACIARFIPYVGPFVAWTTYGLVAYFQGTTVFGIEPFTYALVIVIFALVIDNIIDQLVSPRIMADALRVHPAALLVAVLVGARLFGVIGVIFAGPVLASLLLIFRYIFRKLMDQDPWEGHVSPPAAPSIRGQIRAAWRRFLGWIAKWRKAKQKDDSPTE